MSYALGSEHWEKNVKSLLLSILWIYELYGDDARPSHLQSQSSVGYLRGVTGVDGQRIDKLDKRGKSDNVNIHFSVNSCACACVSSCMCGSAYGTQCSGCVVNVRGAMAAL